MGETFYRPVINRSGQLECNGLANDQPQLVAYGGRSSTKNK